MGKKIVKSVLAFAFVLAGTTYSVEQDAEANESLHEKISDIEEKSSENKEEVNEKKKAIKELEKDIEKVQEDMKKLDEEMTDTNERIVDKEENIEETEERIEDLRNRIDELEERIAERDELLKDRVRAMYQNGGSVNYLEVLMGAKSFGDFLDRVSALNTIAEQDKEILEAHIRDQEELKEAKEEVEEQLTSLEESLEELEDLKADLKEQRKEKKQYLKDLETEEEVIEDALLALEDEEELLEKQKKAAEHELAAYEKRQEEKRQQQKAKAKSSSGSKTASAAAPKDSGGTFMQPATGRITSEYGERWGRTHHGIDIGQGGRSNVPIVAAAAGTVVEARYMNGYGNTVMISHRVDGRQITTLYAHMSSSSVSAGDSVSRGEQIGIMGNTGASKGPHLHFEVHEGPWNGAKSNSVNPRNYLK